MGIVLVILLVLALITMGPIFTIWSLNTLFGLGIPLTIWTWLSALWLGMVVASTQVRSKSE